MSTARAGRLRAFVDEQVVDGRYGSTSEYVRELIDATRTASDSVTHSADGTYFTTLRRHLDTTR